MTDNAHISLSTEEVQIILDALGCWNEQTGEQSVAELLERFQLIKNCQCDDLPRPGKPNLDFVNCRGE